MKVLNKKITAAALSSVMAIGLLAACGGGDTNGTTAAGTNGSTTAGGNTAGKINVWSRDSASGTRGAFEELLDFEGELTVDAAETSGNGDMAAKVGSDPYGIGYVSLTTDFEGNNLKRLIVDGVEATEENVLSGDYAIARPFSLVTRAEGDFPSDEVEQLTAAFVDFLMNSVEGREAVFAAGGIVDPDAGTSWDELKADHPIVDQDNSGLTLRTGGSTSVENTLTAAIEVFQPLAGNFQIQQNHTGSSDGYTNTLGSGKDSANAIDIGFASREFKSEEEVSAGMVSGVYARDAIAIVVSQDNPASEITSEQATQVFKGEITDWSELN